MPDNPRLKPAPLVPPPEPVGLTPVLARNIKALQERRQEENATISAEERVANQITRFAGSMNFVYLHVVLFGFWLLANIGVLPGVPAWDPSFVILATVASVEAIFLSTFVLISQNRMLADADKRADLDLQISLLAEHETTKLVAMTSAITKHFGISTDVDSEVQELKRDVAPEAVLDEIEASAPEK